MARREDGSANTPERGKQPIPCGMRGIPQPHGPLSFKLRGMPHRLLGTSLLFPHRSSLNGLLSTPPLFQLRGQTHSLGASLHLHLRDMTHSLGTLLLS